MAKQRSYEQWVREYQPIKVEELFPGVRGSSFDGTMFETHGDQKDYVASEVEERIWTLISVDDELWIVSGWHFVNRMGYFVTKESFKSDIQVLVGEAGEEE